MLQYISKKSDKYTTLQQVSMVVEGGCRWIELNLPQESDNDVRNAALDVIDICRNNNAFLLIRDHEEVVEELKVSGIHLSDPTIARSVRERLGAGAIIGVSVSCLQDILNLKGMDVDYVSIACMPMAELKNLVSDVRAASMDIALVYAGPVALDNIDDVLACGVNGFAMSDAITEADDPMLYTSKVMEKLLDINPGA